MYAIRSYYDSDGKDGEHPADRRQDNGGGDGECHRGMAARHAAVQRHPLAQAGLDEDHEDDHDQDGENRQGPWRLSRTDSGGRGEEIRRQHDVTCDQCPDTRHQDCSRNNFV